MTAQTRRIGSQIGVSVTPQLAKDLKEVSSRSDLSVSGVVREATRIGLPRLIKRLKKEGRWEKARESSKD